MVHEVNANVHSVIRTDRMMVLARTYALTSSPKSLGLFNSSLEAQPISFRIFILAFKIVLDKQL